MSCRRPQLYRSYRYNLPNSFVGELKSGCFENATLDCILVRPLTAGTSYTCTDGKSILETDIRVTGLLIFLGTFDWRVTVDSFCSDGSILNRKHVWKMIMPISMNKSAVSCHIMLAPYETSEPSTTTFSTFKGKEEHSYLTALIILHNLYLEKQD